MLRLLLAVMIATASATPPPRPSDAPRIEGFHRIYITPDAFADGLVPARPHPDAATPGLLSQPPDAEGPRANIVILVLEPEGLRQAGYTPDTLAGHLREVDDVREVKVARDGQALWVELTAWRDLTEHAVPAQGGRPEGETIPLGALSQIRTFPERIVPRWPLPRATRVPIPSAIPRPAADHDLVIQNQVGARAVVRIGPVEVGELDPLARGVIRGVRPGVYDVTLVDPTGFARAEAIPTEPRRQGVPDGAPPPIALPPR